MGENESKKRMNRFYKKCVCLALNGGNNGTDAIALADVCALLEGNALSLQCIPRSENERQLTVRLIEYLTIKQQQWLLQSMKELEPDDSFPLMRKAQMQFNIETQASRDDTSVGSNMMANYASESDSSHAPERPSSGTKRNRGHNEMNGFGPLAQPWGSQSTEACKSEINIDIETLLASKGLLSSLPAGVTLNILANTPKNSEDAHLSSTIKASRRLSVPKVVTNDGIEVPLLDLKGASPSNNQKSPKSHKVLKSDKSPKNSKSPKNEAGKAERRSGSDTNSPANLTKKTFWSSDDEVERVIQKPAGASIDLAHTPSKAPTRRHTVASVGGFTGQSPRRPPPPSPIMEPRTQQLTQNLALPEEALVIKSVQSTVDSWPIDVKQNNQLDDVSTLQLSNDANKKRSQSEHVLVEETEIPRTQHSPKFSSAPSVNRRPSAPTMSPSTPVAPKVDIATPTHAGFGRSSSLSNTPSTSSISSMFNDNDVLSNMQISTTMSSPRPSPAPAPKSIRVAPEVNAIMPTPSKRGSSKLATSLTSPMTDERSSTDSGHRSEHSNRLQIQRESIERRQSSSPEDCHMGNHSPIFTGKGLESDATRSQHFAVNVAKRAKPIVTPPLNSRHGSRTAESLQPHSEGRRLTVAKFTEISSEPDNNYEYYQSSAPRALVDDYDPQSSYYSDDEYDNSSNMQGRVMPYEVVENIKRPLQSFSHTAPIEKRQLAESFSEQPQRIQSSPSKPMRHYVSDFRESSPQSQDMVMHESVARQRSRERLQDSKRSGSFRGYYDREGPDRRLANEAVQSADSYGTIQDNKKNSDQLGFERGSGHYVAHHSRAKYTTCTKH